MRHSLRSGFCAVLPVLALLAIAGVCTASYILIIPANVPTANKRGNSSVFQLATNNSVAASGTPFCDDGAGNATTVGCGSTPSGLISLLDFFSRPGGTPKPAKAEYQSVATGASYTLLNYTGGSPGYISRMWFAVQGTDFTTQQFARLQIYVDGEGSPSVDCQLIMCTAGLFINGSFASNFIGIQPASGNIMGYTWRIPVPFTNAVKVVINNVNGDSSLTLWSTLVYQLGVSNTWAYTRKLHVISSDYITGGGSACPQYAPYATVTLANVSLSTPGRLFGLYIVASNPNDFHYVEGNVTITLDGVAALTSSGMEDYFENGNTFSQGTFAESFVGTTVKSGGAPWAAGAYRFHVPDQMPASSSILAQWAVGDVSEAPVTGNTGVCSTAWYYTQ